MHQAQDPICSAWYHVLMPQHLIDIPLLINFKAVVEFNLAILISAPF